MSEKIKDPRIVVSARTHASVKRLAKKMGKDMQDISNRIVREGLEVVRDEEDYGV